MAAIGDATPSGAAPLGVASPMGSRGLLMVGACTHLLHKDQVVHRQSGQAGGQRHEAAAVSGGQREAAECGYSQEALVFFWHFIVECFGVKVDIF
jgi:hypothetical protein